MIAPKLVRQRVMVYPVVLEKVVVLESVEGKVQLLAREV